MKARTFTQIRVGLFVIICLILFAIGVFFIGKQNKLFEDKYRLWTSFTKVEGLVAGAPVRLAGVEVGIVDAIHFPETLERTDVIVEMKINRKVQERIRGDSIASIMTMGLMGDKYVEITVGTVNYPVLKEGEKIKNVNPPNYFEILDKGSQAFEGLSKVAEYINEILGRINQGEGVVGKLLTDKGKYAQSLSDLANAVESLNAILTDLKQGKGTMGMLLQDKKLAYNVSNSFASLNDILKAIKAGEGTLGALIYKSEKYDNLLSDLEKSAQSLAKISSSIENNQGMLGVLINDPQQKKILQNMLEATTSLKETLAKVENGEGTLGALINDPTVYQDIKAILTGAKDSKVLKWFIKHYKKKGEKELEKEIEEEE